MPAFASLRILFLVISLSKARTSSSPVLLFAKG